MAPIKEAVYATVRPPIVPLQSPLLTATIAFVERCIPPGSVQTKTIRGDKLINRPGVMVLGHSLKDKGAKARLVVLATVDNLSATTITELRACLRSRAK